MPRGRTRAKAGAALKKRASHPAHHRVARLVGILHLIRSEPGWHAGPLASRFGISRSLVFLKHVQRVSFKILPCGTAFNTRVIGFRTSI